MGGFALAMGARLTRSKEFCQKSIHLFSEKTKGFSDTICEVGRDDPRRVVHAVKVGVCLTLVSLLYLLDPLFEGIGGHAIWAVITVVVVLEFNAGATLCKGLNRGLGTLLAGILALLIASIAEKTGHIFRAFFIGTAVFVIGAVSTYMRFFPSVKQNYDYGVLMFLITFNLITASSYRVSDVLKSALKIGGERFYTIAIGCGMCLVMSLFIFPIWSGEDLHNSIAPKLEGLAKAIEACVNEYFNDTDEKVAANQDNSSDEDPIYEGYKAVLEPKSEAETLALHASWEPRHSRHCRYPWQQYVKLSAVLRHFGYTVVALHGCLQTQIQTPNYYRVLVKDSCTHVAHEISKALLELANSIKNHRHCAPEILSDHLHEALQDLNIALKSQPRLFFSSNDVQPAANMPVQEAARSDQNNHKDHGESLVDSKEAKRMTTEQPNKLEAAERKLVRPRVGNMAITSLEFLEALPLAAFTSSLVEVVARIDDVIEEVEELAKIAHFEEYKPCEEVVVNCETETPKVNAAQTDKLPPQA